jgi:hypothetical protein
MPQHKVIPRPTRKQGPRKKPDSGWLQNPTIVIEHKPVARFRVRGWGIKEVHDPALIDALLEGRATNPHVAEALIREGLFVRATDLPREVKFHAPLSFKRPVLMPASPASQASPSSRDWRLNPALHWQSSTRVPTALRTRAWSQAVLSAAPELWVEDPRTALPFPYWPEPDVKACIQALQTGQVSIRALGERQRRLLSEAGILLPEPAEHTLGERYSGLNRKLGEQQYLVLSELFSPLQLGHLRRYFRGLEQEGYLSRGDSQVERRLAMYREPLSNELHRLLTPLLSRVTCEPLQASYSYFGVYLPGAVLERHRDRPQCRWNLSLIWDTRPDRQRRDAWPIYLEVGGQTRRIKLGMGDGLLYRGTELFHWRNKQPAGNFTTATFFHFVPEGFNGALD